MGEHVHSRISDFMYTFEGETPAWDTSSIFMNIFYVCSLFCHFVNPSTYSFLLIYACVGKHRNLHLCYTPEMLGVTCVFQKPFPFFFIGPLLKCQVQVLVAHVCEREGEENYLSFGSL